MNQISQLLRRLTLGQKIFIVAAAIGVIGGLAQLNQWNQQRGLRPLFSGMSAEDAGTITAKLRESGVEYKLDDNGATILIPEDRVAEVRLQLASAGLPKSGRIGFELFDKANFGMSEFTEQVNYNRAIEGELERSVMSIREVEQARVHVTLAKDSLYTEARQTAKASVLVKLRHAAALSPQNVAAICQLTASAVPGLSPEQVSVIDTSGNLLNKAQRSSPGDTDSSDAALDYRKSVERDIQSKASATLEPLLGAEHFRVGVSAEVDATSADQSEEILDPSKSVMTSAQKTEDGPALAVAGGVPGTPSNLPRPVTAGTSSGSSNYARKTENISYQTSRLVKHTRLPQGGIKRVSVSVLVDHTLRWEGDKRIVEPPSPEKLKVIQSLVAAATGSDPARGDQLVVEAFPFDATANAEAGGIALSSSPNTAPAAPQTLMQKIMSFHNAGIIAGIGGAALLALIVGFFFLRRKSKIVTAEAATGAIEGDKARGGMPQELGKQMEEKIAARAAEQARLEAETLLQFQGPPVSTKKTEVLTKHIAAEAKKDPTVMAQVVRTWLHGENRK